MTTASQGAGGRRTAGPPTSGAGAAAAALAGWACLLAGLGGGAAPAEAQEVFASERHAFRLVRVAGGLERPWSLAFLPDGRMLVTERGGRLRLVADGEVVASPVAGLPDNIRASGQGGLLDVALHPDFAANGRIYLSFAGRGDGGSGTEVARARLAGDRLTDLETVFRALPKSRGGRHFGSRLLFDGTGHLYITLGDRARRHSAQKLDDHRGSVIRLRTDGGVPADNPFAAAGARAEIFTYGNRNVQGIALQPGSGLVWMHEHGPRGGDEVNIVRPGANYGWPLVSHGTNYDGSIISRSPTRAGVEPPVHIWVPSIAPSGMTFYDGAAFPDWRGDLFVGALRDRMLVRLEVEGTAIVGEERLLRGEIGRVRDVRQGPDGLLYLLNDAARGGIYRLEPAG